MSAHGHRGIAHYHQLESTPAQQLDDVERDGQAREAAPIDGDHETGARQTAAAADLRNPAKQSCAHHRTKRDDQQGLGGTQGG